LNFRSRIPLSLLIPGALLLFALAGAAGGVALSLPRAARAAADHGRQELLEHLDQAQGILEHAYRRDDQAGVQIQVSRFAARANIRSVVLIDVDGSILASSRLAWVGQSAGQLPVSLGEEQLQLTRDQRKTRVLEGSLEKRLIGVSPVDLGADGPDGLRPWRTAALVAVYDTEYPRQLARWTILQQAWPPVLMLLALSVITAVSLHFLITRRARRLVAATQQLAGGDWGYRVEAEGKDEFARIGASFNSMVEQLVRSHHDLAERKRHFETLAETTPVGILRTDGEGAVLYVNDRISRLCGVPPDQLLGRGWLAAIHPDDRRRMEAAWRSTVRRGAPSRGEFRMRRPTGETVWVEAQATPERTEQCSSPIGFIAAFTDVTQRKEEEEERLAMAESLRQARRLEAIGRLAGGVAHDFNNLLTVILGNLDLVDGRLIRMGVQDHALREELEQIASAGSRAARLTRQLLAFSRNQVLEPVPLDLNEVVGSMEKLLRRLVREDVEFSFRLGDGLPTVRADRVQIEQVLLNLVANAADAMHTGGWVRISTGRRSLDADRARDLNLEPGEHLLLEVQDSGTGMDEEVLAKVLEPFFTTKPAGQGTGLGLATVHGVVHQSSGGLKITSKPGAGTRVRVYLPVCGEPAVVEAREAPPRVGSPTSATILVCEDDPAVLHLTQGLLQSAGHEVLVAEDANRALAVAAIHPGPIDLLVTDVILPGRSGRELAEALQGMKPDLLVLYLSGYSADILQGVRLEDGATFLRKPFQATTLLDTVERLLREAADRKPRRPAI